jgi:hypothetical protein
MIAFAHQYLIGVPAARLRSRAAPVGGSVPEQIRQLAELRDQGILTVAEFEAKKAELLARL